MDAKYASVPALKGDLVEWLPKYWQSKKGRGQQYIYLSCKSQDKEALVKDLQELGCRWKSGKTVECADELPDEIRIFLDYYIEPVFSSWCSGYKRHVEKENGVLFLEYWKLGLHEDANGQELY